MACVDSIATRNAVLAARATLLANGSYQVRTGAPAGPDNAAGGTLLATFNLDGTPCSTPSGGSMALADVPAEVNAVAAGTMGHLRFLSSSSAVVCEMTIGTSGADVIFSSVVVALNEPVRITGITFTA